jgi:L-fucose isomerase-like protein
VTPATLTQSGNDWTLRIPADSVLNDTHFTLATDSNGQLAVEVDHQSSGGAVVFESGCPVH